MHTKALLFLAIVLLIPLKWETPAKPASSAIAITSDGKTLLTTNPDSNSVSVVDLTTRPPTVDEIPVGIDPRALTVGGEASHWAFVANQGSDSITVIDVETRYVMGEIPAGDRPVGVVLSVDLGSLFVAELGSDTVRWMDSSSLETLDILPVPDRPHGLAVTPDGSRLLVTHLLSGEVTVIALDSFEILTTIPTWANVAPAPAAMVNQTGTRVYLPQTMAHGLGRNTQFDNTVFPKVSVLNLEELTHQTSEHISLPETDQPVGLPWDAALAAGGTELWVVNSASNDISVIDIHNPARPARAAHVVVSDNPRGIVFSPDGTRAYVNNTLAGTVSIINTKTYTVIDEIKVTDIPLPPVLLHGKRLFFSSARDDLARAQWIACNTCHIEGEHDGRTWLLQYTGEVPAGADPVVKRNTTSLLGMVETYPLRWSAEWDESADSEFSVRFEQFGTGLIHDGDMYPTLGPLNQSRSYDLDCLAAYIDSLQVPDRSHSLTEQEARGRAIFESAETGCVECHPAPLYTDFKTHEVGTAVEGPGEWFGPAFDTPTLRFLYDSAPYLHDGSAAGIMDVLTTANPDDQHGTTSHLSQEELEDLAAFLLALPY